MSDVSAEKRPDFLTAKQLAEVLQISETTVHRLRRKGRIPAVYVTDRLVRFNLRDVRRALQKMNVPAPDDAAGTHEADDRQLDFADVFEAFEASES